MTTKTIPRRRGKLSKQDPPVYLSVVAGMGFDPGNAPNNTFQEWNLDQTYPPTVGELLLPRNIQEETDDAQGGQDDGPADASGGGGTAVPGGPEDGDQVGQGWAHRVTEDTEGPPSVPCGGGEETSGA